MNRRHPVALLSLVMALTAAPAAAQEWKWTLVPYLWATDTSLDVLIRDEPVIGGDLPFSDLLDKLDMAAQLHFEGRRGSLGFLLDGTYLKTSDGTTRPPGMLLPGGARIDSEMETVLLEGAAFYRPGGGDTGFDLLLGVRTVDYDARIDLTAPPPAGATTRADPFRTYTDAFAGVRYTTRLGERWSLSLRGDAGTGDTDRSLGASAIFGLHFGSNDRYAVVAGYRHLELELGDDPSGVDVKTELTMSGPAIGFAVSF